MKRITGMFLVLIMLFTTLGTSFANSNNVNSNLIILDNGEQIIEEELVEIFNSYEGEIIKVSDYYFNEKTIQLEEDNNVTPTAAIAIPVWAIGKWVIPLIGTVIITPVAIYIGETLVEAGSALFNSIISAVKNLLLSESEEKVNDVLEDKEYERTTSAGTDIYKDSGGYEKAEKDFEKLNDGEVKTYSNGTKVGQLPDGTSINVRKQSSDGRATLEIQGKYKIKIRYE